MLSLNLLWMSAIALALVVAAFGYRYGSLPDKGVFGLGVALAAGFCAWLLWLAQQ